MPLPQGSTPVTFVLTANRERTLSFYQDVLGLPLQSEDNFAATFDLGGGATMRLTDIKDHTPGPHTVLGWEVSDIRAAMAELRAKGVKFEIYEGFGQDEEGVWSFQGTHLAWFNDPEGNNLSLAQHG